MVKAPSITSLVTGQQGIYTVLNENMNKLAGLLAGITDCIDTPPGSPDDPAVYLIFPAEYTLASVDETNNLVTYSGDLTSRIAADDLIDLEKNDGTMETFTVNVINYATGTTTIYTTESISGGSWANKMHHADGDFNTHNWAFAHYFDSAWHYYQATDGMMRFVVLVDGVVANDIYYFDGNRWMKKSAW